MLSFNANFNGADYNVKRERKTQLETRFAKGSFTGIK